MAKSKVIEFNIPSGAKRGKVRFDPDENGLVFDFDLEEIEETPKKSKTTKDHLKEFFLGDSEDGEE